MTQQRSGLAFAMGLVAGVVLAVPAAGRGAGTDRDPGRAVTLTGSFDFLNTYMFRGIRQDDTG